MTWHDLTPAGVAYVVTCTKGQHDDGVHVADDGTDSPPISIEGVAHLMSQGKR